MNARILMAGESDEANLALLLGLAQRLRRATRPDEQSGSLSKATP